MKTVSHESLLVSLSVRFALAFCVLSSALLTLPAYGQAFGAQAAPAHQVPVIDGELGPCSVEFTVTDTATKPVGDAKVTVHIAYGFMGVRKLDLEASTNSDGKARFTGLPNNLKRGLYFRASQADRYGSAFYDPAKNCKAEHTIVLNQDGTGKQAP